MVIANAELVLIEDTLTSPKDYWKLLVVDDDPDIHLATETALRDVDLLGRAPAFLHAYSASECLDILSSEQDIAVILLDVVMESEQAGLKLVAKIRKDLELLLPRIVLRTGQPGYAPELDALRDYDINDYTTKSELTRSKLVSTVLAAVRSYDQLELMKNKITLLNEQLREKEKREIYVSMLTASHHILNNLLNQLLLFRMEAEKSQDFDKAILSQFNEVFRQANNLVQQLAAVPKLDPESILNAVKPGNNPERMSANP